MSKFSLSERSKANRAGIDQRLISISDLAIQITLIDFGHGPYSGLRTESEQHHLYVTGKSKADGTMNRSRHQDGLALDFYAYTEGASWKPEHLAMVASAFLQAASMLGHRVQWGGLWPAASGGIYGWDMPHIELLEE